LSFSRESYAVGNPADDHNFILTAEAGEITPSPVRHRYRARHAQSDDDDEFLDDTDGNPDGNNGTGLAAEPSSVIRVEADEWGEPADFRSAIRPYTWTRGRTRPVQDLAVETLVSTSGEGRDLTSICSAEHAAIVQLCAEIRSVAEVAALLALPLGVARVLLADVIDNGLVHVHHNPLDWASGPDFVLLERVLEGLYRL
jgi:hypothetical protein